MKLEANTPNQVVKEEVIDLGKYLAVLKKRWLMIAGFTLLTVMIAVLVLFSITPTYKATAVLLIEAEQRNAVSIEEVYGVDTSKKEYFQTQFELLKSRAIAQRVIAQFNLQELTEFNGREEPSGIKAGLSSLFDGLKSTALMQSLLPPKAPLSEEDQQLILSQQVLSVFQSKLSITPVRNTQLVKISFESTDPKLAAKLANAVGEAYIETNMEAHLLVTQQATEWLTERIVKLKTAVTDSEQRLSQFLASEGLLEMSGIDSLASSELTDLSRRLADARDRRVAAESIYYLLQENGNTGLRGLSSVTAISNHPQLRDIRRAEVEAERLVSELSKRYGPKHDKMLQAQAQLLSVKERSDQLLKELASGIGKELEGARKQENAIRYELNSKKGEFQSIAVKRATYDALKRDLDSNRKLYDLFVTRQKETRATSDFKSANARFTDYAQIPLKPAKPKKGKLVAIAAIAGMLLAAMLAFIIDSLHNVLEKPADIEDKLGVYPLGAIPEITASRFKKKALDANLFFDKSHNKFAEAIRSIRTSLLLNLVNSGRKRICITSSVPNEGKTTTSINLAMAMASMEKVVLIDADLRKPSIASRFDINAKQPGLTNHLVMGEELDDCIYTHQASGLSILPAGLLSPNPQELLASNKFAELLDTLEQRFDRVVIDTPPMMAVSDSLLLGRLTGAAILVAKANVTKLQQINHSISQLIKHDIAIDGVVLNKVAGKNSEQYEYYGGYGPGQSSKPLDAVDNIAVTNKA